MKHLFTILAAILLASCASTRYASTYDESRDSTRVSTRQLDSIFARLMQRDSIYIRDSIYVREKGDTVYKYVERLRYKYVSTTDTVMRTKIDTSFVERVELREVEQQVEWYNKCFMRLGQLVCAAIILCVLYYFISKRLL